MELSQQPRYAGFWIRFAAALIDSILVNAATFVVVFPVALIAGIFAGSFGFELQGDKDSPLWNLIGFLIFFSYEIFMNASKYEGTFGKKIVNIKVVNLDGQRLSLGNSFGRSAAKIVSYFTFFIGFMMAGWTKKKTALHDLLAGTFVVYR